MSTLVEEVRCRECQWIQDAEQGVQVCGDCGTVGSLSTYTAVDTFRRLRLRTDQIKALPVGTTLLVSTVWSNYTALTPVAYEGWYEAKGRPNVRYLGQGSAPWAIDLDLREARLYLIEQG